MERPKVSPELNTKLSKESCQISGRIVLISIHPKHVAKILSGQKRIEFRRSWAANPVDGLVLYSTSPERRVVAVAKIKKTVVGAPASLWSYAQAHGPGVTRDQLFDYLTGKETAVALHLAEVRCFRLPISLHRLLPSGARPPQSFRYLTEAETTKLKRFTGD